MAHENKFVFTTEEATSIGVTDPKDLRKLIETARNLALAPLKVGAVGLASSGRVYLGANVEFEDLSIHAEQFLIANLALYSEQELTHLAVSDDGTIFRGPCDYCIHFLQEMRNAPNIKILMKNADEEDGSFKSLEELHDSDSILLVEPSLLVQRDNRLDIYPPNSAEGICSNWKDCFHLKCKALKVALKAARKSYVPHFEFWSGVALICEEDVYEGWNIETVASNTSLGPVETALVDFMARGEGKGFDKITGAVLVEKKHAVVSQEATIRTLLEKIAAPNCDFKVFHCYEVAPEDSSWEMV